MDIEQYLKDIRVKKIIKFLDTPEKFKIAKEDISYANNHEEEDANDIENIIRYVYAKTSEWCNANGYMIYEDDGFYQVKKIPEPSIEEKSELKREERDNLLKTVVDPIVTNSLRWEELDDAQKSKYRAYRLYLLDIPQQEEFPDIEIKSFEEFLK